MAHDSAGASLAFFFREIERRVLDAMFGFAAGVMIAARFWSLLAPAVGLSRDSGLPKCLPPLAGFLAGGASLWAIDRVLRHLHIGFPLEEAEGLRTGWRRSVLLVLAITRHSNPEELAVEVAFGALAAGLPGPSITGAIALAVGIGIQSSPEGAAASVPRRREGLGCFRSFWYGRLSAVVEPIAAALGAASLVLARPILPYALGFAAGAMIYVVVEELVPETQRDQNAHIATLGTLLGFAVMMGLEVALG